ncbi:MAG TPA: DAK2 domain-containing protein [Candidatus Enteromonas pullicola]|uniref:DAK2 domain-containing protein n=1 Tax=Candidatus Alloenteromonas pullicola TaxID=2840784 RepID=A0A9D1S2C6_9FIRM|nr:DAK2 domain-containing protein [Candidatus Enteromonas pullicola]
MKTIDATTLKGMYISAANNLYNHYPEIDQLNVFPVPDGDTGMNMNLTVTSGAKEIQNREFDDLHAVASNFSRGLLMGARGNSGVITSQIFRGFAQGCEGKKTLNAIDLAKALVSGKEVAYKAVMKPVEGTILTVIRESSAALKEFVQKGTTIEEAFDYFLEQAKKSLEHTPELLPVLKEVGVVDSGGAGLVRIIEGMASAVHGHIIERNADVATAEPAAPLYAGAKLSEDDEEAYGYCTQFILRLDDGKTPGKKPFNEKNFMRFLSAHGKSLVTVRDEEIVKVHVHALSPGMMLNYAQQFGEFVTIIIENMSEEHHNIEKGYKATDYLKALEGDGARKKEQVLPEPEEENPSLDKDMALISVCSGAGLEEMFKELGVDEIVSGGQTMNPSTEDFVKAIKKTRARNVLILPNNSNIVMAASQAADVMEGSEIKVKVVQSKTIPQGIASAMMYNPEGDLESVYSEMKSALKTISSGSVTYAIKDTEIEGVHITKGFYMAMKDKNIVSCVKDKLEALFDLSESLLRRGEPSIITVIAGEDVTDEEASKAREVLEERYGDEIEVDVKRGGQPVYSFLVGVE